MLLMGANLIFPNTVDMLNSPDVWFTDTGASCDSTGSYADMSNRHNTKTDDGVTLVDNGVNGTTMIGDINGAVCNKNRAKMLDYNMVNVKYHKAKKYNWSSLTKQIKQGWKIHINNKCI
eukprot:486959-Ditylum_brightwellii.AAC.1